MINPIKLIKTRENKPESKVKASPAKNKDANFVHPNDKKADEVNLTSYNKHNQEWDENWEDVAFERDKGFLGQNKDSYTYKTANGSTINVKNTKGVIVKQNKNTGEIVIIGASANDINLGKGDNLTLIESTAKNINANNGDAVIKVEGANTSVAHIKGGKGSQNVTVSAGAKVESIETGDDDDSVTVNNAIVGKIDTGNGNDSVLAHNANIFHDIKLGNGQDFGEIPNFDADLGLNEALDSDEDFGLDDALELLKKQLDLG